MKNNSESDLVLQAINQLISFGGGEFHKWGDGLVVYSRRCDGYDYYWHLITWDTTRWNGKGDYIRLSTSSQIFVTHESVEPLNENSDQDFTSLRSYLGSFLKSRDKEAVLFEKPQRLVTDLIEMGILKEHVLC
jgi:hypothetical protein